MDLAEKKAALYTSLERAAETLGDVTPHVMTAYYARHPGARETFEYHKCPHTEQLEGEMVEQVIYCLMEWFDSPYEVEIILVNTVPHHIDTLHVRPGYFSDLIEATCDTLVATIPADQAAELAVWTELRGAMMRLVEQGASCSRTTGAQPAAVTWGSGQ